MPLEKIMLIINDINHFKRQRMRNIKLNGCAFLRLSF